MKFKIVAGSVLSLLYVSGGEFLATNIVSETVLIKSPVIMGEPYNDAFTSLLRLGGMDEDAEILRTYILMLTSDRSGVCSSKPIVII